MIRSFLSLMARRAAHGCALLRSKNAPARLRPADRLTEPGFGVFVDEALGERSEQPVNKDRRPGSLPPIHKDEDLKGLERLLEVHSGLMPTSRSTVRQPRGSSAPRSARSP